MAWFPSTGNHYTVGDLVHKYTESGLPIFKVLYKQFKSLAYLTFDVEQLQMQDGKTMLMFKFRNLPGIEHTITETWDSIKWREAKWRVFETELNGDVTASTTMTLDSVADLSVNDVILIYSDDGTTTTELQRRIISITGNDVTLEAAVTAYDTNRVLRLYNVRNDGDDIVNTYNLQGNDEMESFFQNFQGEINFKVKELNKTYSYPEGPEAYVSSVFANFLQHQIHEFGFGFWRGRNLPQNGNTTKGEMLWVITAIENAVAATGLPLITDLSSVIDDDDQVEAIIDEIYAAQMSGLVDDGQPLTIACNYKALQALSKLNGAWNKLAGVTVYDNTGTDVKLAVRRITGPFGTVEFMTDHFLNILHPKKSFMCIMDRNLVKLYMKQNESVSVDGNAPTLNKYVPGMKFEDISKIVNARKPEIFTYIAYTHYATVLVGLNTGAWRIITGVH